MIGKKIKKEAAVAERPIAADGSEMVKCQGPEGGGEAQDGKGGQAVDAPRSRQRVA